MDWHDTNYTYNYVDFVCILFKRKAIFNLNYIKIVNLLIPIVEFVPYFVWITIFQV